MFGLADGLTNSALLICVAFWLVVEPDSDCQFRLKDIGLHHHIGTRALFLTDRDYFMCGCTIFLLARMKSTTHLLRLGVVGGKLCGDKLSMFCPEIIFDCINLSLHSWHYSIERFYCFSPASSKKPLCSIRSKNVSPVE